VFCRILTVFYTGPNREHPKIYKKLIPYFYKYARFSRLLKIKVLL